MLLTELNSFFNMDKITIWMCYNKEEINLFLYHPIFMIEINFRSLSSRLTVTPFIIFLINFQILHKVNIK